MKKLINRNTNPNEEWLRSIAPARITQDIATECKLKVNVNTGRKWKGEGYIVSVFTTSYQYAVPRFRNHSSDFGKTITVHAKVFDPKTNTINEVTYDKCNFVDYHDITKAYYNMILEWIESTMSINIKNLSETELFAMHISVPSDMNFENFVKKNYSNTVNIESATDILVEKQKAKAAAFKEKKMSELIAWARSKGVEKDKVLEVAEKVWKKRYE